MVVLAYGFHKGETVTFGDQTAILNYTDPYDTLVAFFSVPEEVLPGQIILVRARHCTNVCSPCPPGDTCKCDLGDCQVISIEFTVTSPSLEVPIFSKMRWILPMSILLCTIIVQRRRNL